MSLAKAAKKVLVVDDDPIARLICESHLGHEGYDCVSACSVAEARETLLMHGFKAFSAVVSDYRMPEEDGLALLDHVKRSDPSLSVIMVTAEGEKNLVAHSLRYGAVDFLDKPMSGAELLLAVGRAVEQTLRQRAFENAAGEVKQVGHSQRSLLGQSTAQLGKRFRLFFSPREQAGGDFVAAFPLGEQRFSILVSDVSGHDLQAAYRSAYLQGFARSSLANGCGVKETFAQINRFLLNEWNVGDNDLLSLAACIVEVDVGRRSLSLMNCGLPTPYLVSEFGVARQLVDSTASPLGWFDELPPCLQQPLNGGTLQFWSDGLEDLAERLGVSSLSLSARLQEEPDTPHAFMKEAIDDIISVQLDLSETPDMGGPLVRPLLAESYSGAEYTKIDSIQAYCERSLLLALPEIPDSLLHDVLMSIREALLNALVHGCSQSPSKFARLDVVHDEKQSLLWLQVEDEGPGHDFDFLRHEDKASSLLLDEHRGLLMIKHMAKRLDISPKGNALRLDFTYPPAQ